MPIFEYRCEKCGISFEKLIRNRKDAPAECPECKETKLKKLFSSFSPTVRQTVPSCSASQSCPSAAEGTCGGGNCPF